MAYGDYDGPDKVNKGHEGGACNRQRCQAEPAVWYNHGSYSWYCGDCARDIGEDVVNKRDWEMRWQPKLGYPMFETRDDMDRRDALEKPVTRADILPLDDILAATAAPYFGWPNRGREKPQSASLSRILKKPARRV